MGEVMWLRGGGGALMSFAGPLPPFIAGQLARGDLTVAAAPDPPGVLPLPAPGPVAEPVPAAAEAPAGEPPEREPDVPERPAADATKAVWEAYAVSQGMSASRARKTTKAQLARQYAGLRAVG